MERMRPRTRRASVICRRSRSRSRENPDGESAHRGASRPNREPLASGGLVQTLVHAHELESVRVVAAGNEGRAELESVRRAEGVNHEAALGARGVVASDLVEFLPRAQRA